MSDLIDRQDLIKALETDCSWEIFDDWGNRTPTGQAIIETIKKLPSAEKAQLSGEDATFDCISRQDAIDAVDMALDTIDHVPEWVYGILLNSLDKVPSASPDLSTFSDKLWKIAYERGKAEGRKKGKWIEQDAGGDGVFYECSVCKDAFTLIDGTPSDNNYNFCPNCGADMREGEEE